MNVPSIDEILLALTPPEDAERLRFEASAIGKRVIDAVADRRTLGHQIGRVERLIAMRRRLRNPSLLVLDDIDALEVVLARMYATIERAERVCAEVGRLPEPRWQRYLTRFSNHDIVGVANDPTDCPMHRFLVWLYPQDSRSLTVGRRRVRYYHDWGGVAASARLPEWASRIAVLSRAPAITGRKPIRLRRLLRLAQMVQPLPPASS
jgi:hypothetical protein